MYKITFLSDAEDSFKKLDKPVQRRIAQKIADVIGVKSLLKSGRWGQT